MRIDQYINAYYPIHDRIRQMFRDPRKQILEKDDLECDDVILVDGEYQKVVYIAEPDWYITVLDILSLTDEDIAKMPKSEEKDVIVTYRSMIDMEDISIETICDSARNFLSKKGSLSNVPSEGGNTENDVQ